MTLGGNVTSEDDKAKAESIARPFSGAQVVSNQIAVLALGVENEAHKVNVDLGIENNLDAALIKDGLHDSVKCGVKNHVVTLTGDVSSQAKRVRAQAVTAAVPNIDQVVNERRSRSRRPPRRTTESAGGSVRALR